jgi:hypothetical protein
MIIGTLQSDRSAVVEMVVWRRVHAGGTAVGCEGGWGCGGSMRDGGVEVIGNGRAP